MIVLDKLGVWIHIYNEPPGCRMAIHPISTEGLTPKRDFAYSLGFICGILAGKEINWVSIEANLIEIHVPKGVVIPILRHINKGTMKR